MIGDPIRHSRSPAIHNAAFAAAGLDWVFVAFEVPEGSGRAAVKAVHNLGLGGMSVTMPHKQDAAWACDELTREATALGVVNTVVLTERGRLLGASTDGEGFLRAVRDEGVDPGACSALVLGAGGAARAITLALGAAGARVTVAARRMDAAESAAGLTAGAETVLLSACDPGAFDLVVNATPLGMQGEDGPIDANRLNPGQFVVDTVYHPMETPFLAAARARGVRCTNGLGMLVHQAALAFELWTGVDAPIDAMRAAARGTGAMTATLVAALSAVGLAVGWLLDPVITRVPRRQPVTGPVEDESALASSSTARQVTVSIVCGALFGALAARFEDSWALPAYLVLAAALVALSAIDLEHYILPNRIVYPLAIVMIVLLAIASLGDDDLDALVRGLVAGLIAFAIFFVLHMISPRSMGFGDVKLAFVLGLSLGWLGWGEVLLGLFLGFLYGAVIGIVLIATRVRQRNQALPFGPFLAAGALTAILVGDAVITWYRGG